MDNTLRLAIFSLTSALVLLSCGHHKAHHGDGDRAQHHTEGGHHGKGGHHGHGDGPASSPGSAPGSAPASGPGHHGHHVKHLMHQLLLSTVPLQGELDAGNVANAAPHAKRIAELCEGEHVHVDEAKLGPEFAMWDERLHDNARVLHEAAEAGDLDKAKNAYDAVAASCVGCHAQAPSATAVNLGRLVKPYATAK